MVLGGKYFKVLESDLKGWEKGNTGVLKGSTGRGKAGFTPRFGVPWDWWEHRLLQAGCSGAGDDTGEIVMVGRKGSGICLLESQPIVVMQVPGRESLSLWTYDSKCLEEGESLHPPRGSLGSTESGSRVRGDSIAGLGMSLE